MNSSETKTCPELTPFALRPLHSATYPLDDFYAVRRLPLPVMDQIEPDQIPEPYRWLLVHDGDMTSRLEAFHKSKIHIRALARNHHGREYFREVVLELDGSLQPVEFGASKVNLDFFPGQAGRKSGANCARWGAFCMTSTSPSSAGPAPFSAWRRMPSSSERCA